MASALLKCFTVLQIVKISLFVNGIFMAISIFLY